MSNTRFSRSHLLRLDDVEKQTLAEALMEQITVTSHALNAAGGGTQERIRYLRTMRSLLERLSE